MRSGFVEPAHDAEEEMRFSFQDIVVLRTAKELLASRVSSRRVREALTRLRRQLPKGRPLTAVRIKTEGKKILVRDGSKLWNPESGQELFNFESSQLETKATLLRQPSTAGAAETGSAEAWYETGCELETAAPEEATKAYKRTLEIDPRHVDARVNLGRLLHEQGDFKAAEEQYRAVLGIQPENSTALYNLGVLLDDLNRHLEAVEVYKLAIQHDAALKEAHFNLARLYELSGEQDAAFRHLKAYRLLITSSPP